jgi:uncharacterized OB-fold protein
MTTMASQERVAFIRDEKGRISPIIENFYRFCAEGKLMAVKCKQCGSLICPPRNICPSCYGTESEWTELKGRGELMTYTVIHFPPGQFQALAPYAVGILKLDEGPKLPGMIKHVRLEDLRIGMRLLVDFEATLPREWPKWPRYFFKSAA